MRRSGCGCWCTGRFGASARATVQNPTAARLLDVALGRVSGSALAWATRQPEPCSAWWAPSTRAATTPHRLPAGRCRARRSPRAGRRDSRPGRSGRRWRRGRVSGRGTSRCWCGSVGSGPDGPSNRCGRCTASGARSLGSVCAADGRPACRPQYLGYQSSASAIMDSSRTRRPMAFKTALAIAGATPTWTTSPSPLTPSGSASA